MLVVRVRKTTKPLAKTALPSKIKTQNIEDFLQGRRKNPRVTLKYQETLSYRENQSNKEGLGYLMLIHLLREGGACISPAIWMRR